MRIAYFLDDGQSLGGAVITLIQQAFLAQKAGNKVCIYISDYRGRVASQVFLKYVEKNKLEYIFTPFYTTNTPENIDIVCLFENYDTVKKQIEDFYPEIIHSVQINLMAEMIGRELNIPHIMNIYPLLDDFFVYKFLDVFPHFHFCDSEFWAERWRRAIGTESFCIRTYAPKGCKKSFFADLRTVRFVCVGAVYEGKNQLTVVQAFEKACNEEKMEAELKIVGDLSSRYAQTCIDYVNSKNLSSRVKIIGFIDNMQEIYRESEVLICGSKRESFPNAISEAIANDLLVVSTPVAGVPEVIVDGKNGFLTEDYSMESISKKICEAYCCIKTDKYENILAQIRKTYDENHSEEVVQSKLLKCYEMVKQKTVTSRLQIDIILDEYSKMMKIFLDNEKNFTYRDEVAERIWILKYLQEGINDCAKQKKMYVWGVGHYLTTVTEIIQVFLPNIQIEGFIDSNLDFIGHVKTLKPEEVDFTKAGIIVAAHNGQEEMIEYLENKGLIFNVDYFILAPRKW